MVSLADRDRGFFGLLLHVKRYSERNRHLAQLYIPADAVTILLCLHLFSPNFSFE
jgi:hypothetical protein